MRGSRGLDKQGPEEQNPKMKCTILSALAALLLTSCGTTTGLSPKTSRSGFDNARVVSIAPHGNRGGWGVVGTGIGAQWSEAHKDDVILIIAVYDSAYTGITGAELNIDGEKLALTPTAYVTDMESIAGDMIKKSTQPFVTKLDTVEKIIKSKRTWLRVSTPTGTLEDAVIDGATDSKAYHALKRFMDAVKGHDTSSP